MRPAGKCVLVALALALGLAGLTGCSDDGPRTLVAAGEDAEPVGEPMPTTTSTPATSVTTTIQPAPPSTAPTASTAAPAPAVPQPSTPPSPPPELEPGVEPWGYGGVGGSKVVTSGSTTVSMTMMPRDHFAGEMVQVGAEVRFVGGMRSIRIDYGDGTIYEGNRGPNWYCNLLMEPKTTSAGGGHHFYARPGTYTVRVIVTTVDCMRPGISNLPPGWTRPTLPDGTFAGPEPIFVPFDPVGNEQVTTVGMTQISRPEARPRPGPAPVPENCPPQAGGC